MAKEARTLRVRRSLMELQGQYEQGNKKPLEDVVRAWKGIKELPSGDPRSFFSLGGYHGEPFRGAGWGFGNNSFWGGYCNHGNVLFPTWHRVYLFKLEEAMRSIPGCEDVTLPYWDETDSDSLAKGIPWALTVENFLLDGTSIPNPLRSFVFPVTITDNVSTDDSLYTKPKGYETVRFPFSGLVGTDEAKSASEQHNSQWTYDEGVQLLNQNIVNWLTLPTVNIPPDGTNPSGPIPAGVHQQFIDCLNAPNYTVFSNTTSMQQWNELNDGAAVVALEAPHNSIHLAVGGYDVTGVPGQNGDASPIVGANGDMGENDTAALDPIFYFHHCNIDRVFWLWQNKWGKTDALEIIPGYPGTNSSDNQGSTPGIPPNTWLDLATPLNPFTRIVDGRVVVYTSLDCINVEAQLGYTYTDGSLQDGSQPELLAADRSAKVVHVSGINRAPIKGSFVVAAYATIDGRTYLLGINSVLSRWAVAGCANCQTHLDVKSAFSLRDFSEASIARAAFGAAVITKTANHEALASNAEPAQKPPRIEVR
jgi:tyrosinase